MSTYEIHFHYKTKQKKKKEDFPKHSVNICFTELSEEFPRDSNTSSNQPRKTSYRALSGIKGSLYI